MPTVRNWSGSIISEPRVVVQATSVDEIIAVLKDREKYPSPVRAVGSNHSTTRCGVADEGTLIEMKTMNEIVHIGEDTVTAQAGALYIDVANELRKRDLQFHVNTVIGNLSIGSAACGGTKDSSMPGEFGQVCSYATRIKLVTPAGEIMEITDEDAELMQITRSSYGLLGIVVEATFRTKPIQPMVVDHVEFTREEFEREFPKLKERDESMFMYIFPFLDAVLVEFRKYREDDGTTKPDNTLWELRNRVWSKTQPASADRITRLVRWKWLRYLLIDKSNRFLKTTVNQFLKNEHTLAPDQIIRYPEVADKSKYTFSIWAFPETTYFGVLRDYFDFLQTYYKEKGYRCNLANVGYRIRKDTSSLFSYSFEGDVMTVDPVSTGDPGWNEFIEAYNEFCSERNGVPLFNQSRSLTRPQVERAFGERIATFRKFREKFDPDNRLLNTYFKELLA